MSAGSLPCAKTLAALGGRNGKLLLSCPRRTRRHKQLMVWLMLRSSLLQSSELGDDVGHTTTAAADEPSNQHYMFAAAAAAAGC
jgi:hypothetical protein